MIIVEQYIKGKSKIPSNCEDSIYINEYFACILDGTNSKSHFRLNKMTTGKMAVKLLTKSLGKLNPKIDLGKAIEEINKDIYSFYIKKKIAKHMKQNPIDRFSASLIIYNDYRKEIWMIGDCHCLVDGEYVTNKKKVDSILANVRALYIEILIEKGVKKDEIMKLDLGRKYIYSLLKEQFVFQNNNKATEYGYSVIDGFEIDKTKVQTIKIKDSTKCIILGSDGYPKLFKTLQKTEKYLNELLETDPLMIRKHKSTKGLKSGNISFDDRAYIKVLL